jgi:clan AA aspartic protease (TIGR02281 family)
LTKVEIESTVGKGTCVRNLGAEGGAGDGPSELTCLNCYRHPESAATSSCSACLQPICTTCSLFRNARPHCPVCFQHRERRHSTGKLLVAFGLMVVASVGVGAWLRARKEAPAPPGAAPRAASSLDYGLYNEPVRVLSGQLEREPCDRQKTLDLAETLQKAGDYRRVLLQADAFFTRCGPFSRLLWVTFEAHRHLSEWDAAIADATKLIEESPSDQDFRYWRGSIFAEKGHLEQAIQDYQQALEILPSADGVPFELADLYERVGRPCDGLFPIEQFLYHHPEARDEEAVSARLNRLYARPDCGALAGSGRTVLRFAPSATVIRTTALVNGQHGTFVIDTGASLTVLGRAFAEKAGVSPSPATLRMQTGNGVITARLGMLERIQVQGVKADRIPIAIVDDMGGTDDGVLGLSFLTRFSMYLDHAAGRLDLSPRAARH